MIIIDVLKSGSLHSPIGPTGTLRRLIENKEYIENRGYKLRVFTDDVFSINANKKNKKNDDQIWRANLKGRIKHFVNKSKLLSIFFNLRTIRSAKNLIENYLKLDRKPDIIVFHDYFVYEKFLQLSKSDVKKILFLHNDGQRFEMLYKTFPKIRNSIFAKNLEKRYDQNILHLDKIVFISKIGQQNFLKLHSNIDSDRTCCFHNGINDLKKSKREEKLEKYPSQFKFRICCTGTISERKGQYLVLEALNRLDKITLQDFHISFLGSGPQEELLKSYVIKNNLQDHVKFYGTVNNADVYKYLNLNNIYILMSNNEGLPISIIEAMRSGLPIISTKVSGIPEMVKTGYNGYLLNPDVNQLEKIFKNMDSFNWKKMGENSRIRFETEFTFDQMKNSYCNMLDSIA